MKAIVYQSNTGFTKKYADLLAKKTGLPVYERTEAHKALSAGDEIIYMGWLCAGGVKGYEKAAKAYHVLVVCAVGMGSPAEKVISEITERYHIKSAKVFYLQGGFDMNKLHGIYKFMMKMMAKTVGSAMAKKADKTDEEIAMLDMMQNGGDYVCNENLTQVLEWINK